MCQSVAGRISRKSLILLKRFYRRSCQYCFVEVGDTFDHIVPTSKQGVNNLSNIIIACEPCNWKKGDTRLPSEQEEELLGRAAEARTYVINHHREAGRRYSRFYKRAKLLQEG